jgi:hypothetical protein
LVLDQDDSATRGICCVPVYDDLPLSAENLF